MSPELRSSWGRRMPSAVWTLGWISFATDAASEIVYPLLPLFLTATLGAPPLAVGAIEGLADATASIVGVVAGRVSDRTRRRRPLVLLGYTIASLVRPLIALATAWGHVLVVRFADRVGKGLRGAPRDAMLAGVAPPDMRARVFGLQRAMDHAGAVVGPLIATAFLWWRPGDYRALFALTLVPGVAVLLLLRRVPRDEVDAGPAGATRRPTLSWRALPARALAVLTVLFVFTLGNSADAFLLLRLTDAGVPLVAIPALWSLLHVVKSAASVAGGSVADWVGRRVALVAGWTIYAGVYLVFASTTSEIALVGALLAYGLHFGLTEGAQKALLADLVPSGLRATAFGLHGLAGGVGALVASLMCGALWQWQGPPAAFGAGAAIAFISAFAIWVVGRVPAKA